MLLFSKTKNTSKIIINREENNGYMNVIQADIIIEKKNKTTYNIYSDYIVSDFEILEEKENILAKTFLYMVVKKLFYRLHLVSID